MTQAMNYATRHQHIGKFPQLDALALEAGRIYSLTVTTFFSELTFSARALPSIFHAAE